MSASNARLGWRRSNLRLAGRLATVVVAVYFVVDTAVEEGLPEMTYLAEIALEAVCLGPITTALVWLLAIRPLRNVARDELRRQELERRTQRALEMAETEEGCHEVVQDVFSRLAPGAGVQLLLADSSDSHLKDAGTGAAARCGVVAPQSCPAVRRAQTQRFDDKLAIDVCPHLKRTESVSGAVCTPVNMVGRAVGVLHLVDAPPNTDQREVDAVVGLAGARIGMIRVLERTHLQAATDPLTGLPNRRSWEDQAHGLDRTGQMFALAMGDLDNFKALNDVYGHETGDRALRLFARTLAGTVRATDGVARYGGEEFVVLLPELSAVDAAEILRRVQAELAQATARAGLPSFTVSFGVAHSTQSHDLADLLRIADGALFEAKRAGRDRIVVDSPLLVPDVASS